MITTTTVEGGERRRPSSSNTRIQQQSRGRGVKQKKKKFHQVLGAPICSPWTFRENHSPSIQRVKTPGYTL